MRILFYLLRQLSTFADHLARPGRFFQWLFYETIQRTDSVTAGKKREKPLWMFLLAPFRAIGDLWDKATRRGPQRFDSKRQQKELDKKVQRAEKKTRARLFWNFVLAPIVLPVGFLWAFATTRQRSLFWWSLPILIICGLLGFTVYQARYVDRNAIAARYQDAMAEAVSAGDFQAAELFQAKLEQLGVQTSRGEYRTALAEIDAGQWDRAVTRMQKIAPLDRIGFPGAHYWLASQLIDGRIGNSSEQNLVDANTHLQHLEAAVRSQPPIEYLRALIDIKTGQPEDALQHLKNAAPTIFPATGLLMTHYLQTGDQQAAKEMATQYQVLAQNKVAIGEKLSEQESRWDVTSSGLLENEAEAIAAVQRWLDNHPNSKEARLHRAMVPIRQYDRIVGELPSARDDKTTARQAATLLAEASRIIGAEDYGPIAGRITTLLKAKEQGNDLWSQAVIQSLQTEQENGGRLWEQLGTDLVGKDWDRSIDFLQRATDADPQWHRAWNNLAYVLNLRFPERRDEALAMANQAIELDPGNSDYLETRGTIQFDLENWQAAVDDFEFALNGLGPQLQIHESLAVAYQKLGNERKSELHRSRVEKMKAVAAD